MSLTEVLLSCFRCVALCYEKNTLLEIRKYGGINYDIKLSFVYKTFSAFENITHPAMCGHLGAELFH